VNFIQLKPYRNRLPGTILEDHSLAPFGALRLTALPFKSYWDIPHKTKLQSMTAGLTMHAGKLSKFCMCLINVNEIHMLPLVKNM